MNLSFYTHMMRSMTGNTGKLMIAQIAGQLYLIKTRKQGLLREQEILNLTFITTHGFKKLTACLDRSIFPCQSVNFVYTTTMAFHSYIHYITCRDSFFISLDKV